MTILGIDCAPGKGSTVFDGTSFIEVAADALTLAEHLEAVDGSMLLCWDAPLTGPHDPDSPKPPAPKGDYTQRCIERFFGREVGRKAPAGVSVQPYGSCSHWTITRALIGLPRVGKFDAEPPFALLTSDAAVTAQKRVVEVHPAVALWLWTQDRREEAVCWRYKGSKKCSDEKCPQKGGRPQAVREELVDHLLNGVVSELTGPYAAAAKPNGQIEDLELELCAHDDKIDAFVAWLLGALWQETTVGDLGPVAVVGDNRCGSFLLPCDDSQGIQKQWKEYQHEHCPAPA